MTTDTGIQPISAFIAQVKNVGFAKHNHYTFTFVPPSRTDMFGDNNARIDGRLLQLMCSSCILPGVNIGTSQQRTFGEQYDMPNDKTYGVMSTTFYVDNNFYVKKLFDQWSEIIMDPVKRTIGFYDDYQTDIDVTVFDRNGAPHYSMKIEKAFPKSVGDINMSYENHDIMKLDVTWTYRKWSSALISNDLMRSSNDPVNTQPMPEYGQIRESMSASDGNRKDYETRFANRLVIPPANLVEAPDWGGLPNQTSGNILP